jgi:predicted nucleic acid-binding protein
MCETIVITDTSVLINFLVLDKLGLLGRLSTHRFSVTEHVRAEVTTHYGEQLERLEQAFSERLLGEVRVDSLQELELFAELTAKGLGIGECSAIAVAFSRQMTLAIDDRQAIKQVSKLEYQVPILTTESLMVLLIKGGALTIAEADAMKSEWEQNHRFRLSFVSFKERI